MNFKNISIAVYVLIILSNHTFAGLDLVKFKTRNGVFEYPRDQIVSNPLAEGTLLETVINTQIPVDLEEDGSIFVDVDAQSMRKVLHYFSGGNIANSEINSDSILKRDLDFLLMLDKLTKMETTARIPVEANPVRPSFHSDIVYSTSSHDMEKIWHN